MPYFDKISKWIKLLKINPIAIWIRKFIGKNFSNLTVFNILLDYVVFISALFVFVFFFLFYPTIEINYFSQFIFGVENNCHLQLKIVFIKNKATFETKFK